MQLYINRFVLFEYSTMQRIWNQYKFEAPDNIGLIYPFLDSRHYTTWQNWKSSYYKTGVSRIKQIIKLQTLKGENAPAEQDKKSWGYIYQNYFYGRTEEEISGLANEFYDKLRQDVPEHFFDLEKVKDFVEYKLFGQPWNNWLLRYSHAVTKIRSKAPHLTIKRAKKNFASKYAVQSLIFVHNRPKAALLVLAPGWLTNKNLLFSLKNQIEERHTGYNRDFRAPVFILYSTTKGEVLNHNVLSAIQTSQRLK